MKIATINQTPDQKKRHIRAIDNRIRLAKKEASARVAELRIPEKLAFIWAEGKDESKYKYNLWVLFYSQAMNRLLITAGLRQDLRPVAHRYPPHK